MKSIIGIANELFEYNLMWQRSVIFLFFFVTSLISLNLMRTPDIDVTKEDAKAVAALLYDKLKTSEETRTLINKSITKVKGKYKDIKNNRAENIKTRAQELMPSIVDDGVKKEDAAKNITKPTTIDILNES